MSLTETLESLKYETGPNAKPISTFETRTGLFVSKDLSTSFLSVSGFETRIRISSIESLSLRREQECRLGQCLWEFLRRNLACFLYEYFLKKIAVIFFEILCCLHARILKNKLVGLFVDKKIVVKFSWNCLFWGENRILTIISQDCEKNECNSLT